jgi:hypothetical protein
VINPTSRFSVSPYTEQAPTQGAIHASGDLGTAVSALVVLIIIGVLWIAISRTLAASLRQRANSAFSDRISVLMTTTETPTWHQVPDNRPTHRFPHAPSVPHLES